MCLSTRMAAGYVVVWCLVMFTFRGIGWAEGASKGGAVSKPNLEELVEKLEDEERREALIRDLKTLMELQKTEEAGVSEEPSFSEEMGQLFAVEAIFKRFDRVSGRVVDAASSTVSLFASAPEAFQNAKRFISKKENRSSLFRLLAVTFAGILVGLIIRRVLRKFLKPPDRMRALFARIALGVKGFILRMVPYAAMGLALFILFGVTPSFAAGEELVFQAFVIFLFYKVAVEILRMLLNPGEKTSRILPLHEENAHYYWVWGIRFAAYSAFYVLVTKTLFLLEVARPSWLFIRGVLLVVLPVMVSVFMMQIAREVRTRHREPDSSKERGHIRNMGRIFVRYLPYVVMVYSWLIFSFVITNYRLGYRFLFVATIKTVAVVVVILLVSILLDLLFRKLLAINQKIRERYPGLEERTNRYFRLTGKILDLMVVILGVGVISQVWGVPVSDFVSSRAGSLILFRGLGILVTASVVLTVVEASRFMANYLLEERDGKKAPNQKTKTLIPMISTGIKIATFFVGGIVILDQLGVDTTPILAGAGIIGLAVGFGSQTLVKDLINGLFILFEESVRVGDVVVVGGTGGIVESVGLRTVRMRDLAGNLHVIPNSSIEMVTNMTKDYSRYVFEVGVAYREDVDEVMAVLQEIGEDMKNDPVYGPDILERFEILGVDKFGDSAVVIKARITTKPIRQWAVGREFNRRMKKVFDERGIEIPFPHHTIYMGEPKVGNAAPLQIHIKGEELGGSIDEGAENG